MPDFASDLPKNYYYGAGGVSVATPLAVAILILATVLILSLPRKYAFVPFLIAGLLVPENVALVDGGFQHVFNPSVNSGRFDPCSGP